MLSGGTLTNERALGEAAERPENCPVRTHGKNWKDFCLTDKTEG